MKFKKLMAAALAAAISLSTVAAFAKENEDDRVEISFKVGDETLLINGESVTVEKPFVVGEGTTLVPIRVITEAFGAKVDWINDTQTVTLQYPDVSISLQIGNKVATVNDHAETLPEAPVLTDSGFTMVPLRFISETFGAIVSYDGETEAITVVKESAGGSIIEGMTQKAKVGDSYYGWTMNTPKDFIMSESYFDGTYISFTDSYENELSISIYPLEDDIDFNTYFNEIKSIYENTTLTKADKAKDSHGNTYMHFMAKNDGDILDHKVWLTNKYEVMVICDVSADSSDEAKNNCLAIADSFDIKGKFDDTVYDLSDVEDGYRVFSDETYKVSFKLPAELSKDESNNVENTFVFYDAMTKEEAVSGVSLNIYSIAENTSAKELAAKDSSTRKRFLNSKIATVSEVSPFTIGGYDGYEYTITIDGTAGADGTVKDIFFDAGEYVYNLTIDIPEGKKDFSQAVLESFTAEVLDYEKIGPLLRNYPDETLKTEKNDTWSMSVPNSWTGYSSDTYAAYDHRYTDAVVNVTVSQSTSNITPSLSMFRKYVEALVKEVGDMSIVSQAEAVPGKANTYKAVVKQTQDDMVVYATIYQTFSGKYVSSIMLIESDLYYTGGTDAEVEEMVKSFKFLKK